MIFEKLSSDPLSLFSYSFLLFTIATLWVKQDYRVWGALFVVSLLLGFLAGRIQAIALIPILGLAICFYIAQQSHHSTILRVSFGFLGILLSITLAAHKIPGFDNWKILDNFAFNEASRSFSLFLNFDKPLVGLFILGFGPSLLRGKEQWKRMLKGMLPLLAVGLCTIYSISYLMKYVSFEVKVTEIFVVWALRNLFFTCVAEEAFFRGILQRYLEITLNQYKWGNAVSLIAISILFGFAHFQGGMSYIFLASVAGLFYGYAFQKTRSIEASILTHFLLNTVHFIFFTYPALL